MQNTGFPVRRRRRSRHGRLKRLIRAYWPFALVLAAALLSAGVVTLVESDPRPEPAEEVHPEQPSFEGVEHLLNLELLDERLFWDPERLEKVLDSQQEEIILDREGSSSLSDPDLSRVLPGSFMDDAVNGEEEQQPEPGSARMELDLLAPQALDRATFSATPELSTAPLLLTGLLMLCWLRSAA
jgi:hypothetical protein